MKGSNVIVVCFSLTSKQSLDSATETCVDEIKDAGCHTLGVPRILVGLKSDLERKVTREQALQKAAKDLHPIFYLEVSAKETINLEEMFKEAAEAGLIKKIE